MNNQGKNKFYYIKLLLFFILLIVIATFVITSKSVRNNVLTIITGVDHHDPRLPFISKTIAGVSVETTTIAGINYSIPRDYLGFGVGRKQEVGMLIDAVYPDMTALRKLPEKKTDSVHQLIILVTDEKSTTSFQFRYGVTYKMYEPMTSRNIEFSLNKYISSKAKTGINIDERFLANKGPSIPLEKLQADFYVDDIQQPKIYIECNGDKEVANPSCNMHFNTGGFLYDVNFNKTQLENWRDIQAKTIKLIKSFVVSTSEKSNIQ